MNDKTVPCGFRASDLFGIGQVVMDNTSARFDSLDAGQIRFVGQVNEILEKLDTVSSETARIREVKKEYPILSLNLQAFTYEQ